MKEKILAYLVAQLQGVSKAYLDGVATEMSKTITEESQIETSITDGVVNAIKYSAGQLQAEGDRRATEATQTAVLNYEKDHNLKDGKPVIPGGGTPNPNPKKEGDQVPEWAQKLIDDNKSLNEKLANINSDTITSSRKTKLAEAIAKAPDNYRTRIEKDFARMSFEKDDDFDTYLGEISEEATVFATAADASGSVFSTPQGGGTNKKDASDEEVESVIDNL